MNKKIFLLGILSILMVSILAGSVHAQGIGEKLVGYLTYEVNLPVLFGANPSVPVWLLMAIAAIIYSVIFIGLSKVSFFDEMRNPKIAIAAGVTIVTIFTTPMLRWITDIVATSAFFAVVILIIMLALLVWDWFSSQLHEGSLEKKERKAESLGKEKDVITAEKEKEAEKEEAETQLILKDALNAFADINTTTKKAKIVDAMGKVGALDSVLVKIGAAKKEKKTANKVVAYLSDARDALDNNETAKANKALKNAIGRLRRLYRLEKKWGKGKIK